MGFRGGLETGVCLGSSPSDPPERCWGRHPPRKRRPSTITWVCGQDQSDKQARGGRFLQERMAERRQSLRPLRSLPPAGSLPRVPVLGVSRPQGKAWAPRVLPGPSSGGSQTPCMCSVSHTAIPVRCLFHMRDGKFPRYTPYIAPSPSAPHPMSTGHKMVLEQIKM